MDWPDIRATYDAVAADYASTFADELAGKPFDRAQLDEFAAVVDGPVLDLGCGPAGHVTRYLADRGVLVAGVDIAPEGVAEAQRRHPDLEFRVGDLRAIPAEDASLGGIVAFYSVIHLPRAELPLAFAEFRRVLAPGGLALVAMHGGEGETGAEDWFGHAVSVRATLVEPDELAGLVTDAGLTLAAQHERPPYPGEYPSQRLYVLARR